MRNIWIDNRIQYEFRSISKVLIHFSISLIQLVSALAILGLQILSLITQTCVYHIGVGFWSIPFLFISSISIWIVIWRRSSIACFVAIITHLIGTLFATSIIIISFLALIGQIECSTSSLTIYYIPLNSSLIGIAGLFKIFNYCELILLYRLRCNTSQIPTIYPKDLYRTDSPVLLNSTLTTTWDSWSTFSNETFSDLDYLFI
jgi:hypothetical protein